MTFVSECMCFVSLFVQYFWVIFKTICWCWMIYQVQVKRNTFLVSTKGQPFWWSGIYKNDQERLGNIANFDILIQHRINTKTTQYHAESALYENVTFPQWTSEQKLQCREQQYYYTLSELLLNIAGRFFICYKIHVLWYTTLRYDWLY